MAECGLCVNREERALIRSSSSGSLTATGEQHTPFTHTHARFVQIPQSNECSCLWKCGRKPDLNGLGGNRNWNLTTNLIAMGAMGDGSLHPKS